MTRTLFLLRKINRMAMIEWSRIIQYRTDLLLWTLGDTLTPLISLAVWYTVAKTGSSVMSSQETLTYYIFGMFVFIATSSWGGFFLAQQILNGQIIQFLARPYSAFLFYAINNIVEKILKLGVVSTALAIILWQYPQIFNPVLYEGAERWLLFLVSIVAGATIFFTLDMCLGMLAFWLEDVNQIRSYMYMLSTVASGVLIPIAFMPETVQQFVKWLPFRYVVSLPLEILLGQVQGPQTIRLLGAQALWFIGLLVIGALLWKVGLRRYAIPGQ